MPSGRLLSAVIGLVLILAPLRFGAVEPAAAGLLAAACFLVGALWVAGRARRGLPPLPPREPLLWAGALLLAVGLAQLVPLPPSVLAGVSPRAADLRARYEPAVAAQRPGAAMAAPATASAAAPAPAVMAAAVPAAPAPGARPVSLYPWATGQSVLRLLAFLVLALAVADLASSSAGRRLVAAGLVASGGFQAIYGLVEFLSGRQHIFEYAKRHYTDVATGTFINRNHYAGFLAMTLPIALALAAEAWSRRAPAGAGGGPAAGDALSGRRVFRTACWLVAAFVMAVALVSSRSRMGILAVLLAFATMGIVLVWSGRGRRFAALAFVLVAATVLIFSQGGAGAPIVDRFTRVLDDQGGGYGRWGIWSQAGALAGAFPVAGVGMGAFPHVFPAFRTGGAGVGLAHAHNDYLEFAAETGVLGCAAALLAAVVLARRLRRAPPAPPGGGSVIHGAAAGLLAIGFHALADFNLAIPANALIVAALVGLVSSAPRAAGPAPVPAAMPPSPAPPSRPGARRRLPAAACAAALLVLGATAGVSAARGADDRFRAAARRAAEPLEDLQALVAVGGNVAEPTVWSGGIAGAATHVRRQIGDALAVAEIGLAAHPLSGKGHALRGRLLLGDCSAAHLAGEDAAGCIDGAVGSLRAALELSPMSARTHAQVASLLIPLWPAVGDGSRAEVAGLVERALSLNPRDADLRAAWRASRDGGGAP